MNAHTPGPWVAVPGTIRWHGHKPIFENGLWHILPEANLERLPICEVDQADDHDDPTRQRAEIDARLIAAAPELLAACNEVIKQWGAGPSHLPIEERNRLLVKLCEAANKAEGRTP